MRVFLTLKKSVLEAVVDAENEITLASKIKTETCGHYAVIGREFDGRVMADIVCVNVDELVSKIPDEAVVNIIGVWNHSGVPIGITFDDEGNRTGEPIYPFDSAEYVNHMHDIIDIDNNVTRPTEPRLMSNFSGWAKPEMI